MNASDKINYVEWPSRDLAATRAFFSAVFGWRFTDYGPGYIAFDNAGLEGGFFRSEQVAPGGGALIVLYSDNLARTQAAVEAAGATITRPVFAFPGGQRFHFLEPGGNELAVWSE